MESFLTGVVNRWKLELHNRIINEAMHRLCSYRELPADNELDRKRWKEIVSRRNELAKDDIGKKSIFTQIRSLLVEGDYDQASAMQIEMDKKLQELDDLYHTYKENIF